MFCKEHFQIFTGFFSYFSTYIQESIDESLANATFKQRFHLLVGFLFCGLGVFIFIFFVVAVLFLGHKIILLSASSHISHTLSFPFLLVITQEAAQIPYMLLRSFKKLILCP